MQAKQDALQADEEAQLRDAMRTQIEVSDRMCAGRARAAMYHPAFACCCCCSWPVILLLVILLLLFVESRVLLWML
jgi:hypothetical protein